MVFKCCKHFIISPPCFCFYVWISLSLFISHTLCIFFLSFVLQSLLCSVKCSSCGWVKGRKCMFTNEFTKIIGISVLKSNCYSVCFAPCISFSFMQRKYTQTLVRISHRLYNFFVGVHIYLLPKGYCLIQHMCGLCVIFECLIFTLVLSLPSIYRIDTHIQKDTTQGVVSNKQLVCSGFCARMQRVLCQLSAFICSSLSSLQLFKRLYEKSVHLVFLRVLPFSQHKRTNFRLHFNVLDNVDIEGRVARLKCNSKIIW